MCARTARGRPPCVPVYSCSMAGGWPDPDYVVRTRGDVRAVAAAVRQLVHNLGPHRAVFGMNTLEEQIGEELQQPRLTAGLLAGFATLALALAAFGLYSVVARALLQGSARSACAWRWARGRAMSSSICWRARVGCSLSASPPEQPSPLRWPRQCDRCCSVLRRPTRSPW